MPSIDPGPGVDQLTRLSILIKIGQALSANLALAPLLETVRDEVGRVFDTTNFIIVLHRAGDPDMDIALHFEHGHRQPPARRSLSVGFTGHIARSGKPLLISTLAERNAAVARLGVTAVGEPARSWMGVPLVAGDAVVGVMAIQCYEAEGAYSESDLALFSAIGAQIAVAVRNAQLYEDAERRARETAAIASIGRDITASLDLETVFERIAANVTAMLTRDALGIFLEDEAEGGFRTVAASGPFAAELRTLVLRKGRGILGSILESGRAEICPDTSADPRAAHVSGTSFSREGEKVMGAPLFSGDRVIGIIAAWRGPGEPAFHPADLAFLEGVAQQASVAIRNAQLFGQATAALAEAESANRSKSAFLANMSHELRTPLNAILLYSELLADEVGEHGLPDMAEDLGRIQAAGRHLLGLIDGILDLSKIEAGRMSVCLEDCAVSALLADIEATIAPLVAKNRNRLVVHSDPSVAVIHSDLKMVRQTICNLLSNAAKFTRDGMVTLRVGRDPDWLSHVSVSVSDTGIGLSPEQMERIFQEFSQAEDATSRTYGGTGLGLTLCRKFAGLLGGQISVESRLGEGSTFTFRFPGLPAEEPGA